MKIVKTLIVVIILLAIIPALASVVITALWNAIIVPTCGFASLGVFQGVGMFVLGQILSGGFLILLFLIGGTIHQFAHHTESDWHSHWHKMTDEQRREFIERRRREHHFGFRNRGNNAENGGE